MSHALEIRDILIADAVLTLAFTITLSGGIFGLAGSSSKAASLFITLLPIAFVGVSLSFVLHEMMHKFVAQRFGAFAAFRTATNGLAITLITSLFGFLLGIPGATVIYTNSFTKRQNGLVSLAGPLTNFAVFAVFAAALVIFNPPSQSYWGFALDFIMFISILLAFFNMLPIYPLDGSKVLAWNPGVYALAMGTIFVLILFTKLIPIGSILFMIVIAVMLSLFYRRMF